MQAIVTENLTKKYGACTAVDNLCLEVREGELFALLGINGAGKTTTIKMLSGLLKPTSGDALLLGESIRDKQHSVKRKVNISPQETSVAPNLSVFENLAFVAGIYGMAEKEAREQARVMAERFGLSEYLKMKARKLSGGMQRRLSIAMALISEPKILFLDEPTLGLDVLARRELWTAIRGLKGKMTIILTSHYMEEVAALSDRVGVMNRGRLLAVGTVAELMQRTETETLEDAFVALAGGAL